MQKDVQATSTRWSGSNFFRHDSLQQSHQSPKPEVSNEKNAQMWIKTKKSTEQALEEFEVCRQVKPQPKGSHGIPLSCRGNSK